MDKKGGIKAVSDIQQKEIFLENYWKAVLEQDEKTLPDFFREDALISCLLYTSKKLSLLVPKNSFILGNVEEWKTFMSTKGKWKIK